MSAVTKFRPSHIYFLLEHWHMLGEGRYPPRPSTGYTDLGTVIQTSLRPGAHFTPVVEVHAELHRRIIKCGMDGIILMLHYEDDMQVERIAWLISRILRKPFTVHSVKQRMRQVIRYCYGEDARIESYYQWRRNGTS